MKIRDYVKSRSSDSSFIGKMYCAADKNWEILIYIFFGGLTTLVDWTVRFFLNKIPLNYHISDIIGWIAAVLFAFVTNRAFVFESKRSGFIPIVAELIGFAGGRVLSLGIQELLMHIAVSIIGWDETVVMIPVSVVVVVINYFLSKLLFNKKSP